MKKKVLLVVLCLAAARAVVVLAARHTPASRTPSPQTRRINDSRFAPPLQPPGVRLTPR